MITTQKLSALVLISLCLVVAPVATAMNFTGTGYLGYQVAEAEDQDAGGLEGGAFAQTSMTHLGAATLFGGAGLKYSLLSYSTKNMDVDINIPALDLLGGLEIPFAGQTTLQVGFGYDIGLGGEVKWKVGSNTQSKDISEARRLNHQWRILFPLASGSDVGFGVAWFTSSIKASGTEGDIDIKGYTLSGSYGVRF